MEGGAGVVLVVGKDNDEFVPIEGITGAAYGGVAVLLGLIGVIIRTGGEWFVGVLICCKRNKKFIKYANFYTAESFHWYVSWDLLHVVELRQLQARGKLLKTGAGV